MGGHQFPEKPSQKQVPTEASHEQQWRQRERPVDLQRSQKAPSTHFFVKPCHEEYINDIQRLACGIVPDLRRIDASQAHISIARSQRSACHGIDRIYSVARQELRSVSPFLVSFGQFSLYESGKGSACILALDAELGADDLLGVPGRLKALLDKLRLPRLNLAPSFHVNVGWVPIQQKRNLLSSIRDRQRELDAYCADVEFAAVVDRLCLRSDREVYEIPSGFGIPNLRYKTAV